MANVKLIRGRESSKKRLKVAAYARVSTASNEQADSLRNQIEYYENYIKSNPEYEFAGIYADQGISGYCEKRPEFQRMLQDARDGKIDLIITKSITRFARNTDTFLKATRELKELGIGVFFELQNLNSLTAGGEMLTTIYAAFAQGESDNYSKLAKMVYARKYEAGIPVQHLEKSFGYQIGDNGEYEPDENAVWVQKIFEMIADGYSTADVARYLNDQEIKTDQGARFTESTVIRIAENEIYVGDYQCHKHFKNEERKLVRNRGESYAYYIHRDHTPIIKRSLWNRAQKAIRKKREYLAIKDEVFDLTEEFYPYKNHIFCAHCGYPLSRRVYSKGNRVSWGCSGRNRFKKNFCEGVNIPDRVIRSWMPIKGNIYIRKETDELGKARFKYISESTWKRKPKEIHERVKPPALTIENFPYKDRIFCKLCGSRLTRRIDNGERIVWQCEGKKRKGSVFCAGVFVPDEKLKKLGALDHDIYLAKEMRDGEWKLGYALYQDQKGETDD